MTGLPSGCAAFMAVTLLAMYAIRTFFSRTCIPRQGFVKATHRRDGQGSVCVEGSVVMTCKDS